LHTFIIFLFAGSSTIFHALLRRCLARQVVPVCRIVLRNGTSARLVYLLPQEQGDDSLGPLGVAGFQAHYAPFAGECRSCGIEQEELEASQEQITLASKIIKKLEVRNFNLNDYKNPAQRTYFSGVEALALEYEQAEEVIDPVGKFYHTTHYI
jgi:ATP-dependent DNA helicase 2 subunit 1